MKVLFVGGTGNISAACTREALSQGMEVHHLNRGIKTSAVMSGVVHHQADINDRDAVRKALVGLHFDAVVNWVVFKKEDVEADIATFKNITRQYVLISSAAIYHKPPLHYIITESTPAYNPYWEYARKKHECEQRATAAYVDEGFPVTIVRPSHTYSDGWFLATFGRGFTVPQRMLDGKEIVVHGEGTSLWTVTHAEDFAVGLVGLLGNPQAIGETFHITSDEALTWDQIHRAIGAAFDVNPKIVHVPSEFINKYLPDIGAGLLGDRAHSVVFDNAKIKRYVPTFRCRISYHEGMRRSAAWWAARPDLARVEAKVEQDIELILRKWRAIS